MSTQPARKASVIRLVVTASAIAAVTGSTGLGAAGASGPVAPAPRAAVRAAAVTPLIGTFRITAGSCASGVTGSHFRMLQPGGTLNGPDGSYLTNADSTCTNKTYTPLVPGTNGGLVTGSYQPNPNPAFAGGDALARRIIQPASFFGVDFSVSTAATDPQTGAAVPAPGLSTDGTNLTGNLRALSAAWNNQHFNQGAPKPDGTNPGLTSGPTGTYNPTTRAYTLTWTSQIVGGPFNAFTGQWVLAGTFVPATPRVGVGNASVVEGRSGSRLVRFTVSLASPAPAPVTAAYTTAAGTATAGSDFAAKSGTVTIPAGATSALVSIRVKGDAVVEPNEAFTVKLSGPTGATLARATGTGTIVNDDPTTGRRISIGNAAVPEGRSGSRLLRFTVSLSNASPAPASVAYATTAGTAAAGSDFAAKSGTVTIPAGATSALVSVGVKGDAVVEVAERFTVRLSAPAGAALGRATATGTILNDD